MKQKLIAILVLLIVASAAGYYWNKHLRNKPAQTTQKEKLGERVDDNKALPKQMPANLIVDKATINESYEIPYDKARQSTVNLETADSVKAVYDTYVASLEKQGYLITNQKYNGSTANIYAYFKTKPQEVNIVIYKDNASSKTQVVISYLNKDIK